MLCVEDVVVSFGGRTVLDGVDLDVPTAGVVALLGASGSGKSTLLRVIAGLLAADRGTVTWDDHDLAGVPTHKREFGMLFQDHVLFPHRDVGGNVELGLRMQHRDARTRRTRVAEMLELVGLSGYERRRVSTLSGGEQQRVALARALAPSPRLLLLDEPFGALDRPLRDRLVADVGDIVRAAGIPTIVVTHDRDEAFALADRVGVLAAGRIEQCAAPAELWARPATEHVASLIGLGTAVDATVRDDAIVTPWGVLPRPDAGGPLPKTARVLLRPDALTIDPRGSLEGVVRRVAPHGGRTMIEVELGEGAPLWATPARDSASRAPATGERVRVHVARDAIVVFDAPAAPGTPGTRDDARDGQSESGAGTSSLWAVSPAGVANDQ